MNDQNQHRGPAFPTTQDVNYANSLFMKGQTFLLKHPMAGMGGGLRPLWGRRSHLQRQPVPQSAGRGDPEKVDEPVGTE